MFGIIIYYINLIEFEKRSIRATGQLQAQLRCPVSFSPSMGSCDYNEVLRIYQEAGGKTEKVVLTHLDCRFHENLIIIIALKSSYVCQVN